MMQSGYTVKRYSEVPKTITLTRDRIFQLRFCRSLICSCSLRARIMIGYQSCVTLNMHGSCSFHFISYTSISSSKSQSGSSKDDHSTRGDTWTARRWTPHFECFTSRSWSSWSSCAWRSWFASWREWPNRRDCLLWSAGSAAPVTLVTVQNHRQR